MPKRQTSRKGVFHRPKKRNDYQPTKAKMEESFRIPTMSVLRTVTISR